jgi:hypothetical protein
MQLVHILEAMTGSELHVATNVYQVFRTPLHADARMRAVEI